eukprot:scaffold7435_cov74-Skeletonema_menzelii.AAC.2
MDVALFDRQQEMVRRDFDYYEARARDVKLAEDSGEDFGWLGYFIGNSKHSKELHIFDCREGQNIEAFIEGINRNRLIETLNNGLDLGGITFRKLNPFFRNINNLSCLCLKNVEVGMDGAQSLALTLTLGGSQCQSFKTLCIEDCNLNDEGFAGIAVALRIHPQLEQLRLRSKKIGLIGCIALGDTMRGWGASSNLKSLNLYDNAIDDRGLQALVAGMTNSPLEELNLDSNLITGVGLRSMNPYFQSGNCRLRNLRLYFINFGDEGALALADGLKGNKSLRRLQFHPCESGITDVGWAAFSKLLCDPSSINNTYHSNHNIDQIGYCFANEGTPPDMLHYISVNHLSRHPHEAAIRKILISHPDLDMEPFFQSQWNLKLLPVVIDWFKCARSGVLPIDLRVTKQRQRVSLRSIELSALYKFVRSMPALTVISYWQQVVANTQVKRRRIDDEMRRLDSERLRSYHDEEAAWVRLGRPISEESSSSLVRGLKRMRMRQE